VLLLVLASLPSILSILSLPATPVRRWVSSGYRATGMRVGVDTGGTFTDVVSADGRLVKVPSTPTDPAEAVAAGVGQFSAASIAHGTTVATNALLEGRGAPVALVTNDGLEDVIEIGRQNRPSLYDQWADRPSPLVPRHRRHGVAGRLGPDGAELEPLGAPPDLDPQVGAVAVCLLHADVSAHHEQALAAVLRGRGLDVTCSHEISPEFREYERTVTTVVNAALRPLCAAYLRRLRPLAPHVDVMTSAGGLISVEEGARRPAALLLSGPAAGVRAAAAVAAANGFASAISFDMGGTSTDVCLIEHGLPDPAPTLDVGGYPVRLAALAIHTIGAGGGSIAALDAGGALAVGPRSAGAVPGPACYRRGGAEATVTDADLVLGRIPDDAELAGIGPLDRAAAAEALRRAGVGAVDVVTVVDATMAEALRVVSVARGVDPEPLALVAFGGAGPLHGCALADALGMAAVIVPARAGVFSAVGLLAAPVQVDLVRSWPTPLDHTGLTTARRQLAATARGRLGVAHRIAVESSLDCRYAGQSHELTVADVEAFHDEHARRNGYARPADPVEVVALRARASVPSPVAVDDLPAPDRRPVVGPAVVAEPDATIWVPAGWRADVGDAGAYVLRRTP
jgi:N-methylhydantoinase A/oxoprolinase/acetone carboxylase beta subunit